MFNTYAARLLNAPIGEPLPEQLEDYFGRFCNPCSPAYWPEFVAILREQHPAWFSAPMARAASLPAGASC